MSIAPRDDGRPRVRIVLPQSPAPVLLVRHWLGAPLHVRLVRRRPRPRRHDRLRRAGRRAADRRLAFLDRALPLVLPLLPPCRRPLHGLLADGGAAPLVALVGPRLGADPLHDLFSGRAHGRDQRLVRALLRPDPGGPRQVPPGDARRVLRRHRHLPRNRARLRRGGRAVAVLRQPLHLPLAHGDERLLHAPLAAAAPHRGRLAARPGRHHALLDHHRAPRDRTCSTRS